MSYHFLVLCYILALLGLGILEDAGNLLYFRSYNTKGKRKHARILNSLVYLLRSLLNKPGKVKRPYVPYQNSPYMLYLLNINHTKLKFTSAIGLNFGVSLSRITTTFIISQIKMRRRI